MKQLNVSDLYITSEEQMRIKELTATSPILSNSLHLVHGGLHIT